ncbi:MAG: HAMP domain-containing protein [Deltaproteobacteria bacterium]|nr:HAMP domain-containing protein [Deltaproteobacteria bacterium]
MTRRTKLFIAFFLLAILPMFIVGTWMASTAKKKLEQIQFLHLESISDTKVTKIEEFFNELKRELRVAQDYYSIKKNLPVLTRFKQDKTNPNYIAAQKMLDGQMKTLQKEGFFFDVMLVRPDGKIAYTTADQHQTMDLGHSLPDPDGKAFEKGKKGFYFSEIFRNRIEDGKFTILATAPLHDFNGKFIGVFALEVNMQPVYALFQDFVGLGKTGETLIVKKMGDRILFLNPRRYDPEAALEKTVLIGDRYAIPAQKAALGGKGFGHATDYRGKKVITAWRYIPSLDWGLVTKIDEEEAFASVTALEHQLTLALAVLLILTILAAYVLARAVSDPILKLTKAAERISQGNLDYKTGIKSGDEIGKLAHAFDAMTQRLKQTLVSRDVLAVEVEERKRLQSELKTTLYSIGDAVMSMDISGRVVMMNPIAEQLTGWSEAEAKGRSLEEIFRIVNEETRETVESPVTRVLKEGVIIGLANHTILISRDERKERPIGDSGAPIFDKDGKVVGVVLIFRDLTKEKEAEKTLKEATEIKSKFTSIVSHEIRNPLTTIKSAIENLKDGISGTLNEKQSRVVEIADCNADRLARLVNNVLDFQKMDSGKMKYDMRENDICDVVREVQKSMAVLANEKGLNVTAKLDEKLPKIRFDKDRIVQVLTNLVGNAVKFTEKGAVSAVVEQRDNTVHVMVQDTGPGIKTEDIPKLFQTFEQLDSTRDKKKGGTGLGLAISKEIILSHKGKIWAESEFGLGSTFHFTLPL